MIPLFKPFVNKACLGELKRVLFSGYIGEGKKVKEFERLLSSYLDGNVALVNSATSALHLAYHMSGVEGGEVITTPMTCLATNIPLLHHKAKVVWADVDPKTGNIDQEDVARKLSSKTRAIVCVHYGGNLCSERLKQLADNHGVPLIEDCAHLLGPGIRGWECYSFQAIKFMTTGDGGAFVTQDKKVYERAKLLRWYGMDREAGHSMRCLQDIPEAGFKFHMNDIAATIGIANHQRMKQVYERTQSHAQFYNKAFSGLSNIQTIPVEIRNDYWLYILLVNHRDEFMDYMKEQGIETSLVHARNDTQSMFRSSATPLPGLEEYWRRQVCIPVGWWLTKKQTKLIAEKVCEFDTICSYSSR